MKKRFAIRQEVKILGQKIGGGGSASPYPLDRLRVNGLRRPVRGST